MKRQIGVIGLGKFGLKFGETLMALGHEVLGIDADNEKVMGARHILTQVCKANAMNKQALEQIRVQDLECILISVGSSIAASAMISLYLKELGVPRILAKAVNEDHEKLLYKIGVDEVIIPEFMAARQIASRIVMPGFIDYLPFDESMAVKEFSVKKWAGRSLRDLDLTNKFGIQVIAIRKSGEEKYQYIPRANYVFVKGDILVAIGEIEKLLKIES